VLTRTLLLFVLLLTSCSEPDWPIPTGLTDEAAMKDALTKIVPAGTSITDAQERLQANGFACVYQWHAPLAGDQNVSYLYCHREEGTPIAQRSWQAAVMMKGVTVGDVRVKVGAAP
jgi:hypothetical protein